MKLSRTIVAATLSLAAFPAFASVMVRVRIATQRMTVSVDGAPVHSWSVSTGRQGYRTPTGSYRVQRIERRWRSRPGRLRYPRDL